MESIVVKSPNNGTMVANLQKIGLSFSGAKQVLAANAVTSQKDRDLLAKLTAHVAAGAGTTVTRYNFLDSWPSK